MTSIQIGIKMNMNELEENMANKKFSEEEMNHPVFSVVNPGMLAIIKAKIYVPGVWGR